MGVVFAARDVPLTGVLAIMFLVRNSKGGEDSSGCNAGSARAAVLAGCRTGAGGAATLVAGACKYT